MKPFPRVEKVILTQKTVGNGTDRDPFRLVLGVYKLNGEMIAENDPFKFVCLHKNTRISEPHLAGARECVDCGAYYNPNMGGWNEKARV